MRIAQVAPLYESVPPKLYGGTERVVSYLTEELVRLGHEVTLFASGDSQTQAKLVPACPRALWRDARLPGDAATSRAAAGAGLPGCVPFRRHPLPLRLPALPAVAALPVPERHHLARAARISRTCSRCSQSTPRCRSSPSPTTSAGRCPGPTGRPPSTMACPADLHTFREQPGDYLAFLGRISPEKRLDRAIEIARRTGGS